MKPTTAVPKNKPDLGSNNLKKNFNGVVEQKIWVLGVFYDHRKIDFTIDRKMPPRKLSIVKSI